MSNPNDTERIRREVETSEEISEFQRKVYLALLDIPLGRTITYGELGMRIGCRSAQAIGQALKKNPFAPRVPCHRVVAANGGMGGYCGATEGPLVEKKMELLRKEMEENGGLTRKCEDKGGMGC